MLGEVGPHACGPNMRVFLEDFYSEWEGFLLVIDM
jgi:hypothetical protein